jgi:uncharacterized membrane protein YkoI
MKLTTIFAAGIVSLAPAMIADTPVKMEDLPPAVQRAGKEKTKDATLVGLSKEKEKGKTFYEAETKVGGKTRDLLFDATGAVVDVEEEVDLASIPAAAKAAIEKKSTGGTIERVETVTHGLDVSYEAAIKTETGRKIEYSVNADGSVHK